AYTAESPVTDGWAGAAIDITVSYGGIKEYEVSVAVFEEPASTTTVITPSSLTADAGTAIPVTITLKDQYSNTVQADCQLSLVTDYGETDISSGSGTAHSPVSLDDAYLSTFSITATRSAVTSVRVMSQCPWESSASLLTSIPITVTPGEAVQAESSLTVADSVVAGAAISTTSEFRDAYKNLVTPSSVKIQFGTGGPQETAVLDTPTSTYSTSTTAVTQAGTTSVIQVVSSPHAAAASQKDVTVTHAAPVQANTTVTPTSYMAGSVVSITVTGADQYSNPVTSANCHIGFGSALAATTEATYNSGSYYALVQASTTAGDADLYIVWNKGLSTEAIHTKTITITGGLVSAFTISDPATIELDVPSPVVFTLQDSYGNAAVMVESPSEVWATIMTISTTPVVATYSAATDTYSATFTGTTLGAVTLTVEIDDGANTWGPYAGDGTVTVVPAGPNGPNSVLTVPTGLVAGTSFSLTLTLYDALNELFTEEQSVSALFTHGSSSITVTATYDSETNVYTMASKSTIHDVAATFDITITVGDNTSFITDTVTIAPGAPTPFGSTYMVPMMPQTAGDQWEVTLSLYDEHFNAITETLPCTAVFTMGTEVESTSMSQSNSEGHKYAVTTVPDAVSQTAGTWYVAVTVDGTSFLSGMYVQVDPAEPSSAETALTVATPSSAVTAGDGFTVTLTLKDEYDNTVTDATSVVGVFSVGGSDESITATRDATTNLYTITSTAAVDTVAETHSLSINVGSVTDFITGESVTVTSAAPASAESTYTVPTTTQMAGSVWPVSVSLYDEYRNECRTGTISVEAVYTQGSDSTSVTLSQVTGLNVYTAAGPAQARFTAGVWAVSITADAEASFLSGKSVTVTPAAPYALYTSNTLSVPSSDVPAGDGFTVSLTLTDVYFNVVTDATSVVGVFSVGGTDEAITATYNSSTNLYTIASTTTIDTVANTYSLSINVGSTTGFIT
ncbi:hypothetical protein KIPB_010890, partial [Kipferlia bialata]